MKTQLMLPFAPELPTVRDPHTYWRRFRSYMRSSYWKWVAERTLEIFEFECQARKPGCTFIATDAHHTTYLVWNGSGDVPGVSTTAVCRNCHQWIHAHPIITEDVPANDNLLPSYYRKKIAQI